jgi:formylglycine-generating enzyme required for sulfatase activity
MVCNGDGSFPLESIGFSHKVVDFAQTFLCCHAPAMSGTPPDPPRPPSSSSEASRFRSVGQLGTQLQKNTAGWDGRGPVPGGGDVSEFGDFQKVLPDRYRIVRELGRGGMGQVLLAIDRGPHLDKNDLVAIKRMLGPVLHNSASVKQFLDEVSIARTLRHPNVVRMYHSDNTPLGPYIVMEYIEGEDLGRYIERLGPVPESQALVWFGKLAAALDEGHGKRLIHRDLKPKNILIDGAGEPYLADFGIARRLSEFDQTGTGFGTGTPAYMSPEQLENRSPTVSQDIYSFGATLYHAVTGRPPFEAETIPRLIVKIMSEPPPRATGVSSAMSDRIAQCLAKDGKSRPRSCGAVLAGIHDRPPVPPPITPSPSTSVREAPKAAGKPSTGNSRSHVRSWLVVLGLCASLVAIVMVMAVLSDNQRDATSIAQRELPSAPSRSTADRTESRDTPSPPPTPLMEPSQATERTEEKLVSPAPPPSKESNPKPPKRALDEEITNSIGMKFRLIRPGTFRMGSPASESGRDNDETQHSVTISKPYYLGIYEVTQEQYERVMGKNPSYFKGARDPVENVSWEDAVAFIEKLNGMPSEKDAGRVYRLPTEAEWEYACRAGSESAYCFGEDVSQLGEYEWFEENSGGKTHPVGEKRPNAWGLYDMHGNVLEWCNDWEREYPSAAVADPSGPARGSRRVCRGGCWDYQAASCRSADRGGDGPGIRYSLLGFRLALSSTGIPK